MSNSLQPHGLQHTRPPCPSPTPGVYLNSCPLSPWCHPTISSSVVPFSSCPQSFPASGSFLLSWLFTLGGKSIGTAAPASVLPMNTQDWSALGWTGWISLQSKGLLRVLSNTTVQKASMLRHSGFFIVQLSHPYMTTGKTIALTRYRGKSSHLSYCVGTAFFRSLLPYLRNFLPSESTSFKVVRNVYPQTALHLEYRHVTWAPPLSSIHANILRREQGYRGRHHVEFSKAGVGWAWQRDAQLAAAPVMVSLHKDSLGGTCRGTYALW